LDINGFEKGYKHGTVSIWMLKHKPDGNPEEFGRMDAKFMKSVVGLRFNININAKRARTESGVLFRKHEFDARYFDERGTQLLNMNEASKL
jgi:hypothetical protein